MHEPESDKVERLLEATRDDVALKVYVKENLRPSQKAKRSARRIGEIFVKTLNQRTRFKGDGIKRGSFTRKTSLARNDVARGSDVDILCFISHDRDGSSINNIEEFEGDRDLASDFIKKELLLELKKEFARVQFFEDRYFRGLNMVFRVKVHPRASWWKVDVGIAFGGRDRDANATREELRGLSPNAANRNTNAMYDFRHR